jgi:tetratricopeptide (TPR) repeat protein
MIGSGNALPRIGSRIGAGRISGLWLLLAWLTALAARGASPTEHFNTGNTHLAKGQPAEALAAYGQIAPEVTSAALEFNRGLAHAQLGQLGQALGRLRRAERLAPRDREVGVALRQVRARVSGPAAVPTALGQTLGRLTLNEWAGLTAVSGWTWFGLLFAARLRPAIRQQVRGYTISFGLMAFGLAAALGLAGWSRSQEPTVIATQANAAVRISPLDEAKIAFTAHDGAEFRLTEQRDGWLRVEEPASGRSGWLSVQSAVLVPFR